MSEHQYKTLGKFIPAVKTVTLKFRELVDSLWGGEVGEVEFTELALGLGMDLKQIGLVLHLVRAEDGTL